jgi:septal ring factor EnvC (AmiA/AmiB activator)
MSEINAADNVDTEKVTDTGDSGYHAPATQADLDRIITERLNRERGKFADYDDLKARAERLDEIEQATKSETEKFAERASAAEAREAAALAKAEAAELKALKSDVAREKGVPAGSLTGTTIEELEASADELVAWRDANAKPVKPKTSVRSTFTKTEDNMSARERAVSALRNGSV